MRVHHEILANGKATVFVDDVPVETLIYMSGMWHWKDRQFQNIMVARDVVAGISAAKKMTAR